MKSTRPTPPSAADLFGRKTINIGSCKQRASEQGGKEANESSFFLLPSRPSFYGFDIFQRRTEHERAERTRALVMIGCGSIMKLR